MYINGVPRHPNTYAVSLFLLSEIMSKYDEHLTTIFEISQQYSVDTENIAIGLQKSVGQLINVLVYK